MNCDEHFGYLEKKILTAEIADIPGTFNGKPVTAIGEKAFKDAAYPERVTFPDSVKRIEEYAFSGCSSLRETAWANRLEYVGYGAFEWRTAPERLELPEGLQTIDMCAFKECISLRTCTNSRSTPVLRQIFPLTASKILERFAEGIMRPLSSEKFASPNKRSAFNLPVISGYWYRFLMERYFPYMKKSGRIYREEQIKGLAKTLCYYLGGKMILESENSEWFTDIFPKLSDSLFNELSEAGDVELTAWLPEYKNRRFGFDSEGKYEL